MRSAHPPSTAREDASVPARYGRNTSESHRQTSSHPTTRCAVKRTSSVKASREVAGPLRLASNRHTDLRRTSRVGAYVGGHPVLHIHVCRSPHSFPILHDGQVRARRQQPVEDGMRVAIEDVIGVKHCACLPDLLHSPSIVSASTLPASLPAWPRRARQTSALCTTKLLAHLSLAPNRLSLSFSASVVVDAASTAFFAASPTDLMTARVTGRLKEVASSTTKITRAPTCVTLKCKFICGAIY